MARESGVLHAQFLFDANAFVDIGERFYPPDIFGIVWEPLMQALDAGTIVTCKRVLSELRRVSKPEQWRKDVSKSCASLALDESDSTVQAIFGRLATLQHSGALSGKLSDVDLLILGCGEAHGLPIVTRDTKMVSHRYVRYFANVYAFSKFPQSEKTSNSRFVFLEAHDGRRRRFAAWRRPFAV